MVIEDFAKKWPVNKKRSINPIFFVSFYFLLKQGLKKMKITGYVLKKLPCEKVPSFCFVGNGRAGMRMFTVKASC